MAKRAGPSVARTPVTTYGAWVYGRLLAEAMTVKELAERVGVKRQNLSSYLHGRGGGYGYRRKIEAVLGEPPTEIKYSPDALAG